MAGGMGRRFGGDKQVEPVGPLGQPLGAYTAYDALKAGFAEVVLVARPGSEGSVRASFRASLGERAPIRVVPQTVGWPVGIASPAGRVRPWGTAHAALAAAARITGAFGIANADDGYGRDALRALFESLAGAAPGDVPLVTYAAGDVLSLHGGVSRGWVRTAADGQVEVVEVHELRAEGARLRGVTDEGEGVEFSPETPVSMNLWGMTIEAAAALRRGWETFVGRLSLPGSRALEVEYALSTALNDLARAGAVRLRPNAGGRDWFGMTFASDRPAVTARIEALHADGSYPASLTIP